MCPAQWAAAGMKLERAGLCPGDAGIGFADRNRDRECKKYDCGFNYHCNTGTDERSSQDCSYYDCSCDFSSVEAAGLLLEHGLRELRHPLRLLRVLLALPMKLKLRQRQRSVRRQRQ